MRSKYSIYLVIIVLITSLLWVVIHFGEDKYASHSLNNYSNTSAKIIKTVDSAGNSELKHFSFLDTSLDNLANQFSSPLSKLVLQVIIIIILSRGLGLAIGKLGQPIVIGEIIAGIILGPSLLGTLFPATFDFIFPSNSLRNLQLFSQFGLILFMFIIGMEIDAKLIQKKINSAVIISYTGIIFPFFLGILLSFFIYDAFALQGVSFTTFSLFIGVAMSITAFPVLARIIHEKGLTKTPNGMMAITCAATDDVTAWLIFAAIIAFVQAGSALGAIVTLILAILFIILMLFLVQPILKKIGDIYVSKENLSKTIIAFIFLVLFCSAIFTEIIGIHALFGAFIAGVVVPKNKVFKKLMINKIEDVSTVILLPLFFAYTGLRTQIGLLNTPYLWVVCVIIILIAITGKLGGVSIAARFVGNTWRDSLILGVLMNTRGLMELIVLNIGYDLGILSPEIFSMMVIMAITTTFMAGPSLNLIERYSKNANITREKTESRLLKVLISFGRPQSGSTLVKLANSLLSPEDKRKGVIALHMTPHTEISRSETTYYEQKSFGPIKSAAGELGIRLKTIYKSTNDVAREIMKCAGQTRADLLLVGGAKSLFDSNVLGGKIKSIIDQNKCNVGIYIGNDIKNFKHVLLMTDRLYVENIIDISDRLIKNSDCNTSLMFSEGARELAPDYMHLFSNRFSFIRKEEATLAFLNQFDLIITNVENFERYANEYKLDVNLIPCLFLFSFSDNTFKRKIHTDSR